MPVAKMPTIRNYADALAFLDGKTSRKIGHNTELVNDGKDSVGVRYHDTVIVRFHQNGALELDCNGWPTMTTLGRMHQFAIHKGFGVGRSNWKTTVTRLPWKITNENTLVAWDHIMIRPDGTVEVLAPQTYFEREPK